MALIINNITNPARDVTITWMCDVRSNATATTVNDPFSFLVFLLSFEI